MSPVQAAPAGRRTEGSVPHHAVLAFQRSAGNRAVQRLLGGRPVVQRVLDGTQMGALYGVTGQITISPDAVNGIFETNHATISTWLPGGGARRGAMGRLQNFLRAEGANFVARYQALAAFNAYFARTELQIGEPAPNHLLAAALTQFIANLPPAGPLKAELVRICAAYGVPEVLALFAADPTFARLAPAAAARAAGSTVVPKAAELAVLVAVHAAHPPGSGFAGGMPWGTGELPSVALNQDAHFRKHCLRSYMPDKNPDTDEPWKWMAKIPFAVTRHYVETIVGPLKPVFATPIFGAGTQISTSAQADFFFNFFLPRNAAVATQLEADHKGNYINYVQASASALTNPFVILNSGKVQVIGLHGADEFVVGKWDTGTGAFGISTSYLNPAKIAENLPYKLWDL